MKEREIILLSMNFIGEHAILESVEMGQMILYNASDNWEEACRKLEKYISALSSNSK